MGFQTIRRSIESYAASCLLMGPQPQSQRKPQSAPRSTRRHRWMLTSTALVLMMTIPGWPFLRRAGTVQEYPLHPDAQLLLRGLISITWVLYGYSLAFGPDKWAPHRGLDFLGCDTCWRHPAAKLPPSAHAFCHVPGHFAIITPALISGAFAERDALFGLRLVHAPVVHVDLLAAGPLGLGNGWIEHMGALDFAAERWCTSPSGMAALVAAIYSASVSAWP